MEAVNLICFKCKHFGQYKGGCDAFPDGIPSIITSGQNRHNKPLTGQKNTLLYEPIKVENSVNRHEG